MSLKTRGELITLTDTVALVANFKDQTGTLINTDAFPQVSITQPSGLVAFSPTSAGVTQLATGQYSFTFAVPINGPLGLWNDLWFANINGFPIQASFQFLVNNTDVPQINSDGYYALGDDVGFNYSQLAILNINKIIKPTRARLSSSGKAKRVDANGNVQYIDCDIYSVDMLTTFAVMALSNFNQIPFFTSFGWEDSTIIDEFLEILTETATVYALASKALIERGREFQITDNGLSFNPPTVSELLNTQAGSLMAIVNEKIKYIKNSMRPGPKGLGGLTITSLNPALRNQRNLRARRIY